MRWSRKPVYLYGYRGFESLPLRTTRESPPCRAWWAFLLRRDASLLAKVYQKKKQAANTNSISRGRILFSALIQEPDRQLLQGIRRGPGIVADAFELSISNVCTSFLKGCEHLSRFLYGNGLILVSMEYPDGNGRQCLGKRGKFISGRIW